MAFQYLKGDCKKDRKRLFTQAYCDRMRGDGFKLKEGRFRLDVRKIFKMRVVKHWHRLSRDMAGAPALEAFKARLDVVLGNLV